ELTQAGDQAAYAIEHIASEGAAHVVHMEISLRHIAPCFGDALLRDIDAGDLHSGTGEPEGMPAPPTRNVQHLRPGRQLPAPEDRIHPRLRFKLIAVPVQQAIPRRSEPLPVPTHARSAKVIFPLLSRRVDNYVDNSDIRIKNGNGTASFFAAQGLREQQCSIAYTTFTTSWSARK